MTEPSSTCACECEHEDHFDHGPGHAFGHRIPVEEAVTIRTLFGTFTVCAGCRRDHLPDEILAHG